MIVRILIAGFSSIVGGVCYLSGLLRLMSALLVGFGALAALFGAVIFLLPAEDGRLWLPVHGGGGSSWPFLALAGGLLLMIVWILLAGSRPAPADPVAGKHFKALAGGLLLYLCSLFGPAYFWFPSAEKLAAAEVAALGFEVVAGVCLYLSGSAGALYLLYRASRGTTNEHPDLMRRFVPALFAVFHLDKMPALVAYLLIYSPETHVIFPKAAALALAAYIPIGVFLARLGIESHTP